MKKLIFLSVRLVIAFSLVLSVPLKSHAQVNVIASFSILGDIAKNIGQDKVKIRTLVGPDSDAHVYEASPSDAIAMSKADLIIINGLQLEGFISRLIKASETSAPVIEAAKGANIIHDPAGGHYHFIDGKAVFHAAPNDPHAWQSLANVMVYAKNIAASLCQIDNPNCDYYQQNARSYSERLSALQAEFEKAFAGIADEKKTLVVGHNAFRYFSQEYGVKFLSVQGVSTESEASAADVAGIVRDIKNNHASAIFAENISNPALVEQIAQEANMKVAGVLYSDALSAPSGPAPTYIDMMKHNVKTIIDAINKN